MPDTLVPIGDFCKTGSGGTPSRSKAHYYLNGTIPWVKSGELNNRYIRQAEEFITEDGLNNSSAKIVGRGAVLIAMYGATVGKVAELEIDASTNQAVCNLVPDPERCDKRYLVHSLEAKYQEFISKSVGGGQPNISQQIIKSTRIPLPPLPEQRRIAAILDKADALRQKRRLAIAKLDELLQSVFLEMFGDPVANPKGWPMGQIGDLLESAKYGTSVKAGTEGEWPVLRMNNITYEGEWDFTDLKYMDMSESDQSKYLVQKGELLFNRTNSKELVGKTAVYRQNTPMAFAGYLVRARALHPSSTEYIAAYLNSHHGKLTLRNLCKNIVGMANINAKEMQRIKILIPPCKLQDEFQARVSVIRDEKQGLIKGLSALDALFSSLQQRAFSGRL